MDYFKRKKIMNKNTTRLTSGSFPVKSFIENVTFKKIVTFTHVAKATTAKMVEFFNHQAFDFFQNISFAP